MGVFNIWERGLGSSIFLEGTKVLEQPFLANVICNLQNSRKKKNLELANLVQEKVCINGLDGHSIIGNYIVPMFVECGSVADAQKAFNRLFERNQYSWKSLLSGYIASGQLQHALNLYYKMQEDGVPPNSYTITTFLKACARAKDLEKGEQIRMDVMKHGFERDPFVGSALVDMYAKCGSLGHAQQVFDKLPVRDTVTWTTLIAGYADNGFGMKALGWFEQMQQEGVSSNAITYVCSLKACGTVGAINRGREMHSEIVQKGFEKDIFIGSILIDMYARCGAAIEAQQVFDRLPVRDVACWTALIAAYVESGSGEKALKCFDQMQLDGIIPNSVTLVCCLNACCSIGARDRGREIHMEIARKGLEGCPFMGSSLVDMYAKCGSLLEARQVFDKLPVRNVVTWNTLISGYAENGSSKDSWKCFEEMQSEGVQPDAITFVCSLKACDNVTAALWGRELHAEIMKSGFETDVFVGSSLIDMYAKYFCLEDAEKIFDKLPVRNVVSWNALIAGYAGKGYEYQTLKCFQQMQFEDVLPNDITYICSLKACASIGAIEDGRKLHIGIMHNKYEGNTLIGNTLVDMYAKCGSLIEAQKVFDTLPVQDIVSWNVLITGYVDKGWCLETLKCLEHMKAREICLNDVTFTCCLKACCVIGAIDKGRELHFQISGKDSKIDIFIGTTLIDMYARCGFMSEASQVFDNLGVQPVASWNAMIRGYGMNCDGAMAVSCFENMQQQYVMPDVTTFTCLLSACSRNGLVVKGLEYFRTMQSRYGIAPEMDHYTCIVDLLARSGSLHEAENLIQEMPLPSSDEAATALLSACKNYGERGLGLRCFQQLAKMNSRTSSFYVLMANIYAHLGSWDDANKMEEMRKCAGAIKKPARAWIEVDKKVHEFVGGNDHGKQISAMLEDLSLRMREEGHVPNVDLVLKPLLNREKEITLCGHAEKLAIAFGLLHTPQGQALHINKSLRMCDDCHNASKVISRIERREIILRESNWIHHFKDGLCSCGDMW